ncbi:MAG: TM2 domain-containing protein [Gemmatimonadota bacterium]
MDPNTSPRSRLAAALLCFFLGVFGAHRFYVGKIGTGILTIVTLGGCFGIWPMIDLILIAVGAFTDAEGRPVTSWEPAPAPAGPAGRATELQGRMDGIDRQLTELQQVMIDLSEKLDRRQYGHLV